MAARTQALARALVDDYGGSAAAVWETAATGDELYRRLKALPGFGDQKARIFLALLAKRLGVQPPGLGGGGRPLRGRRLLLGGRHRQPRDAGPGAGVQAGQEGGGQGRSPARGRSRVVGQRRPGRGGRRVDGRRPAHRPGPGRTVGAGRAQRRAGGAPPPVHHHAWPRATGWSWCGPSPADDRRRRRLAGPPPLPLHRRPARPGELPGRLHRRRRRPRPAPGQAPRRPARSWPGPGWRRRCAATTACRSSSTTGPTWPSSAGPTASTSARTTPRPPWPGASSAPTPSSASPPTPRPSSTPPPASRSTTCRPGRCRPRRPSRDGPAPASATCATRRPRRGPTRPWFVTGGVTPDTVGDMVAAGARRFVVVRWLTESDDPRRGARPARAGDGPIDEAPVASGPRPDAPSTR